MIYIAIIILTSLVTAQYDYSTPLDGRFFYAQFENVNDAGLHYVSVGIGN